MKIVKKVIIGLIIAIALAGSFVGGYFVRNFSDPDMASLRFIIDSYKKYYLEESDDYLSIMGNSILDDYSYYYTKEEYELLNKVAKGSRAGMGIQFYGDYVYKVIGNSPAEKAGVTVGGRILAVKTNEAEYPEFASFDEVYDYIDNIEEGVEFSVKIEYADGIKEFSLKKSEYQETYVYYSDSEGSYRFNDEKDGSSSVMKFHLYGEPIADFGNKTAYIKYTSFNGTRNDLFGSVKQIQHVLDKFKADEKENLIFDLRGNGGGYLDIAQKLSAHFIDGEDGSKKLMSKAIYKDGTQYDFYSAKVDYSSYGFKNIIFLADAGSASASEVLIGSALDYDKRGIVKVVLARSGSAQGYTYKSYGKGIMQDTFPNVGKGDAIRLTVAKIYWPLSDICVHGVGITKSLIGEKCVEAEYGDGDYVLAAALGLLK